MTSKEALLMLKLGAVIRRPIWNSGTLLTLNQRGEILVRFSNGDTYTDTVESFLIQKHTDWEVYCPQDNK
ncbi:hypothetical protein KNV77_gp012 [Klebsiella phage vB_KpnP_P184]|uniref:Uncharacterized protein n=1 Tax=Klebsiella phage vB_KpnP_P184 TaxID=2806547 RepID=A0A898KB63_9CAUD|nr:hypothetical protein KNV77_gp012 [Klebsiella phage vB_KpnP_P184]QSJ03689.1 hypothetical protein [Klebsiella phage vB_KpnP_P184]